MDISRRNIKLKMHDKSAHLQRVYGKLKKKTRLFFLLNIFSFFRELRKLRCCLCWDAFCMFQSTISTFSIAINCCWFFFISFFLSVVSIFSFFYFYFLYHGKNLISQNISGAGFFSKSPLYYVSMVLSI